MRRERRGRLAECDLLCRCIRVRASVRACVGGGGAWGCKRVRITAEARRRAKRGIRGLKREREAERQQQRAEESAALMKANTRFVQMSSKRSDRIAADLRLPPRTPGHEKEPTKGLNPKPNPNPNSNPNPNPDPNLNPNEPSQRSQGRRQRATPVDAPKMHAQCRGVRLRSHLPPDLRKLASSRAPRSRVTRKRSSRAGGVGLHRWRSHFLSTRCCRSRCGRAPRLSCRPSRTAESALACGGTPACGDASDLSGRIGALKGVLDCSAVCVLATFRAESGSLAMRRGAACCGCRRIHCRTKDSHGRAGCGWTPLGGCRALGEWMRLLAQL
eukprot:1327575-Pleurochrysis_carterae.AAC.4